jgi:hypothetical protein
MYTTPLDILATTIDQDIFNHKHYRPKVKVDNLELYHLLIPDVEFYIFNFVFDSSTATIDSNLYNIDLLCKNKYGSSYAYPLIMYINGFKGLQDIADKTCILPNQLVEFANKYKDKYDNYVEESIEVDTYTLEKITELSETTVSGEDNLKTIFAPIFAEA